MNIKKSLRIIFRNKTYSLLNIAGLTIGITAAALIFLWVESKVNFNKAIPNSRNIYIAGQHNRDLSNTYNTTFITSNPLSKTLEDEFPEVKRNTRYNTENLFFIPENTTNSFEEAGAYADSSIFEMISMKFISGNKSSAFDPAYPIVISRSMAQKIYGSEDPVGKGLINEGQLYEITGVFNDLPDNTTFEFEWLIPFRIQAQQIASIFISRDAHEWGTSWLELYVELEPHININQINEKLKTLPLQKAGPEYEKKQIFLYPLNRILLYKEFENGIETGGGYNKTVRLFFLIGVLILVIACINFMNLSTARSQKRALEIGVRKTFGTKRKYLIRQFIMESGLITTIALIISIGLIWLTLPLFNSMINARLSFDFTNPYVVIGLIVIGLFCTFMAGSYPALYLSSFNPVTTIKMQKVVKRGSAAWIRQGLVVFQFIMAFILICTTYVIYLQIQLAQNRDIGIEKENLVLFPATNELRESYSAVLNELESTGLVESSGFTFDQLLYMGGKSNPWFWNGKDPNDDATIVFNYISEGLIAAAGIKLIEGTDIGPAKKDGERSKGVLINETLAKRMGEEGRIGGNLWQLPDRKWEIVGIMKDFIYNDPYTINAGSVIFYNRPERAYDLFVRLKSDVNTYEAIARIRSVLQTFSPYHAFEPTLMTDRFEQLFENESLIEKLSALFAALAIFISCLGLLGLSAFSAEQRTKEIGVRKVLGAKTTDILVLLGKSYVILLLVSFIIGIPISAYIAHLYLKDYAYRIVLTWDIFAGVALLITLIALLTVSSLSIKAAITNPAKSIKTE
ncbi:MAG: ABC transporter permease [Tannerella sp.]|jgi:ABC-type antimicrobial peptide transport system permease subunit|nr:ABC transporter permease [Tannerella sp.]